ncbi:MAG: PKD domain-containing protein, partial [Bacteroidetes bacterium]|nr:PKD domain-containing protein [Bacteroidota bacterium]
MKKTNESNSSHRIDDYLLQLEKQEKTKRRRKGMLIILLGGIIATGFVVAKFLLSDSSLPMYAFDDLDTDFLVQLQENDQLPILVNHPGLGIDTIASIADYTELLNLSYSITSNQSLKVADSSPIEQDSEDTDNPELPLFALDIEGKREKDQKLRFIVENYEEEVDYQIDFGNGYRTSMGESVNYSYPRPGKYQVKLISTKGGQTSIYTKRIDIQSTDIQTIAKEIKPTNTDAKVEMTPQNQANHQKTNEKPDSIEENSLEGIASNRSSTDQLEIEDLQTAPIEKLPVKKITNPQEKAVTPSAEQQNNKPNNE